MIIDFTIRNFLSIKNEATLSFLSNQKQSESEMKTINADNKYRVSPFCAIYGANASGKSNIMKALSDFILLIIKSHAYDIDRSIPVYKPYKLDTATANQPVYFEIEFVANSDNKRYLYLIEFNKKEIITEEMYFYPEGRKAMLFKRNKTDGIKYGTYFGGEKKGVESFLTPNRLFLSLSANSTNDTLKPAFDFFRNEVILYLRMDSTNSILRKTTLNLRKQTDIFKPLLQKMLHAADFSVNDIKILEDSRNSERLKLSDKFPDSVRNELMEELKFKPYIGHAVYTKGTMTNEVSWFDLDKEESTGTIKMYDMTAAILDSLQKGSLLVIDEFNSGLHPMLNTFIVDLFLTPSINTKNAQLLIATHDICVLDMRKLKREQIWFTEKTESGETDLFSLDEFDKNSFRENSKYSKYYLDGRFGAVPAIDLSHFIKEGV